MRRKTEKADGPIETNLFNLASETEEVAGNGSEAEASIASHAETNEPSTSHSEAGEPAAKQSTEGPVHGQNLDKGDMAVSLGAMSIDEDADQTEPDTQHEACSEPEANHSGADALLAGCEAVIAPPQEQPPVATPAPTVAAIGGVVAAVVTTMHDQSRPREHRSDDVVNGDGIDPLLRTNGQPQPQPVDLPRQAQTLRASQVRVPCAYSLFNSPMCTPGGHSYYLVLVTLPFLILWPLY